MTRIGMAAMTLACLMAAGASDARAQGMTFRGYATPFVGLSAGGSVDSPLPTLGASVSVHEESGWGAELDAAFANDSDSPNQGADFTSVLVNVLFTRPTGAVRPYVTGGAGVLNLHGCLSTCPQVITANDLGVDAGGGAYLVLADALGLRADVRYVWAPGDHPSRPSNYGFWRATVGFTFMWVTAP